MISIRAITKNHILISITCIRQAYRKGELASLFLVCSDQNMTDASNKDKVNTALQNDLRGHKLQVTIQQ